MFLSDETNRRAFPMDLPHSGGPKTDFIEPIIYAAVGGATFVGLIWTISFIIRKIQAIETAHDDNIKEPKQDKRRIMPFWYFVVFIGAVFGVIVGYFSFIIGGAFNPGIVRYVTRYYFPNDVAWSFIWAVIAIAVTHITREIIGSKEN